MSAKHTPGPWTVWKGHFEVYAGVGKNTPGGLTGRAPGVPMPRVADCDDMDLDESEMRANARLIAAAPELLAFVRLIAGMDGAGLDIEDPNTGCNQTLRQMAAALMAKAEGKS